MNTARSDRAVVDARRNSLLTHLANGCTVAQAAEFLRQEGFPADIRTIQRDVAALRQEWRASIRQSVDEYRDNQLRELQEIRTILGDPSIKPKEQIQLLLQIISTESEIVGTRAPNRTLTANVSVAPEHSQDYLDYKDAFAGLSDEERREELARVKARKRSWKPPVLDASFFPPPMLTDKKEDE